MKQIRHLFVGCLLLILSGICLWGSQVKPTQAFAATIPNPIEWPLIDPASPNGPTVIGGEEATPGAWPWMVALVHATNPDSARGQFCGGSIIAADWVLTAAHCTYDLNGHPRGPHEIDVVVDRHNLTTDDGLRISVLQIIRHPGFGNQNYDNDIALLQLAAPTAQRPLGLVTANDWVLEEMGQIATIIGWGITEAGSASDVLRQVTAPLVDVEHCRQSYGIFNSQVTDNMICAGLQSGGKDSCHGDSGGPLMVFDQQADQWKQVGIVSWGEGCAEPNYFGVYTRLSHYVGWVSAQIPTLATPTTTPTPTAPPTPTSTPTLMPTAPPSATPTLDATDIPANQSRIIYLPLVIHNEVLALHNGSFEEGITQGWEQYSLQGAPLILSSVAADITPHSGNWLVKLGGRKSEVAFVYQKVTVTRAAPILEFWRWIESTDSCGYDFGGVIINGLIVDQFDLCESKATGSWQLWRVDLQAFVGMTVVIEVRAETDKMMHSTLWIDDIALTGGDERFANGLPPIMAPHNIGASNRATRQWIASLR